MNQKPLKVEIDENRVILANIDIPFRRWFVIMCEFLLASALAGIVVIIFFAVVAKALILIFGIDSVKELIS